MTFRNRASALYAKNISLAIKSFSFTEKSIFFLFFIILLISGLLLAWTINTHFLVDVPNKGGSLVEGIVGSPRFANPLLASSDADKDLTSLVYSGLLKATPDGTLVHDLAQDLQISEDGLTYTVTLKDDIYFHDGEPVTADDVVFTVRSAQDSGIKSPRRINWVDVTVEKRSDKEIVFTLKRPYSPFIENLTTGILPEHMWKNLDGDQFAASLFNTEPIGSGPYEIKKVRRNAGGLPVLYELSPFEQYALGEPYIEHLTLRFYTNEDELLEAYIKGDVESINGVPPQRVDSVLQHDTRVATSPLPRVFGLFFNQNQAPLFVFKEVREALSISLNKERIIREVLNGYGNVLHGPILLHENETSVASSTPQGTQAAIELLTKNGWVLNPDTGVMEKKTKNDTTMLAFSISTGNADELKQAALIMQEEWRKIGADVDVKVFETSDLNQDIIRPRKYDALLFGEVVGRDLDLYPFWHSSQRNDPGLNIAMYTNSKADKILEDMRATTDQAEKEMLYRSLETLITDDIPALFTYSPHFIYLIPSKIQNLKLGNITTPAERFMNIDEWYVQTNKVWKIFVNN